MSALKGTPQLEALKVEDIIEGDRLRRPDAKDVKTLSLSLQELGTLINPIRVRPHPDIKGKYLLISGATRLAAAKLLGWQDVDAIIQTVSEQEAALEEVDENLYRGELTASDRTLFAGRRLNFFEFKHGKLSRSNKLPSGDKLAHDVLDNNSNETLRFYDEVDQRCGIKRRTAQRLVRRARNIPPQLWALIQEHPKKYPGALLDAIADFTAAEREEVADLVVNGECSVAEAVRAVKKKQAKKAPSVAAVLKVVDAAWDAWGAAQKKEFLAAMRGKK